jgi:hypothetical protein
VLRIERGIDAVDLLLQHDVAAATLEFREALVIGRFELLERGAQLVEAVAAGRKAGLVLGSGVGDIIVHGDLLVGG